MKNKLFIRILSLCTILALFTSCDKINLKQANNQTTQANETENIKDASYSITNGDTLTDRSFYYTIDARIPQISSSNENTSDFISSVNEQIKSDISNEIIKSKNNAENTYKTYLDSAEANFEADKEKRINALKNKYKSILGKDEVKAIANALIKISYDEESLVATSSEIEGFTGSENLIIDGLHNKKIIVVEKTEKNDDLISQTTITIEGTPGKKFETIAPPETTQKSETIKKKEKPITTETKTEIKEIIETKEAKFETKDDDYEEVVEEELTLEGFYKELEAINNLRTPNKNILTRQFIRTGISSDYEIKCLDDTYISLIITIKEERSNTIFKKLYYNIDIKNEKVLTIEDVKNEIKDNENAFYINNHHKIVSLLDKYLVNNK